MTRPWPTLGELGFVTGPPPYRQRLYACTSDPYTAETDPNESLGRPGNYTGKAAWTDTRLTDCTDAGWECGGDIEVFDDEDNLNSRYDYLSEFASEPLIGGYYMWKVPSAVVRVGFALTPDQADTYQAALEGLYPGQVTTLEG